MYYSLPCIDDDTEQRLRVLVRKHKPLLDINSLNDGEIPTAFTITKKCRSVLTMKKLLETISKQQGTDDQQPTAVKSTSIRQSPTT